jgi:hypothetical protein
LSDTEEAIGWDPFEGLSKDQAATHQSKLWALRPLVEFQRSSEYFSCRSIASVLVKTPTSVPLPASRFDFEAHRFRKAPITRVRPV